MYERQLGNANLVLVETVLLVVVDRHIFNFFFPIRHLSSVVVKVGHICWGNRNFCGWSEKVVHEI